VAFLSHSIPLSLLWNKCGNPVRYTISDCGPLTLLLYTWFPLGLLVSLTALLTEKALSHCVHFRCLVTDGKNPVGGRCFVFMSIEFISRPFQILMYLFYCLKNCIVDLCSFRQKWKNKAWTVKLSIFLNTIHPICICPSVSH
jgi:hypothetical protein